MGTGPDEGAGRGRMRAGHDDREQVIAELKAAFVQGRLDKGELEERAGRAVASRTYGELAALTADIPDPAPSSEAASADAAAAGSTPGRTLARGVKRAGICLLAGAALMEAAFLTGNFLLIVAATFAALAAGGFLGYGIIDAVQERRTLAQLTAGPGSGPGGAGPGGGPPARGRVFLDGRVPPGGRVPPAGRDSPGRVEVRARRPRPAGRLQRGWAVS